MVKAKLDIYYTAKKIGEGLFEFQKWEEFGDQPIEIYKTHAYGASRASCSCPAWRPCKHMRAIDEVCDKGLIGELPFMRWTEKKGWEQLNDMKRDGF